jgi:hypothetical protein
MQKDQPEGAGSAGVPRLPVNTGQTAVQIVQIDFKRKRPEFLSITHKLDSDHDSNFDVG